MILYSTFLGLLAANPTQSMNFLNVENENYACYKSMPQLQVTSLGLCLGASKYDSHLKSLNLTPWIVCLQIYADFYSTTSTTSCSYLA